MNEKLKGLSGSLQAWSKDEFGSVLKEIKKMKEVLNRLREAPGRRGPSREEIKVQDKLAKLYHREEIMWRQRSRVQWLKEGDWNTKFFQQKAILRKKKNKIGKLCKPDGTFTEDKTEMGNMAKDFFGLLYTSEGCKMWIYCLRVSPGR